LIKSNRLYEIQWWSFGNVGSLVQIDLYKGDTFEIIEFHRLSLIHPDTSSVIYEPEDDLPITCTSTGEDRETVQGQPTEPHHYREHRKRR